MGFLIFIYVCLKDLDYYWLVVRSSFLVHWENRVGRRRRLAGDWSRLRVSCGGLLGGEWRSVGATLILSAVGPSLERFVSSEGMIRWAAYVVRNRFLIIPHKKGNYGHVALGFGVRVSRILS